MKILHVIANLAPRYGGPAKAAMEMSEALAKLGHQVSIFTTDQDGPDRLDVPLGEPVLKNGVEITYFPIQKPSFWGTSLPMAAALKREIPKYDIVHIHALYLFHNLAAGYYSRKYKVPYIVCPHGTLDPFIYQRHRSRKRLMEMLFENRNFRNAAALHFITEEEMHLAKPVSFDQRGMVVPIGLDLTEFAHMPDKGAFRARYPELKGKKMILFFGRLNFKKGLDLLIKSFRSVLQAHPDAALVLTGPDNDQYGEQVRQWVREENLTNHVLFTGMLTGQDKLAVLQDADLFVLPSYSENFGIAVIEALVCGTPVIVSDKVNIWREVVSHEAGLVCKCETASVAEQIIALLDDPGKREAMGRSGIDMVRKQYHWDHIGQSLESEYRHIIQTGAVRNFLMKATSAP
ncbi:glycosyltransferase [Paenibacillus elgii]|uniref:glycosyltransferase n=1 Tax=Paenibacillus elgii TaxID=189691 RepID=UPI002D7C1C6A|nr:glycosyltransferase [Paenibacillus elgii]